MDIFNIFKLKIINIIQKLSLNIENKFDFESVQVNAPKDNKFGDLTSNVALSISKVTNINAIEIAQLIADKLLIDEKSLIKDIDIINPGFINITLKSEFWYTILETILQNEINYNIKNIGNNKKINIEYVSANPTGYLHIGHARGAVVGSVLSNLYKFCGYDVTQEYYINDAGNQIKGLALSLYYRYCEYFNKPIEKPTDFYPGLYIIEAAESFIKKEGDIWLNKTEEEIIPYFSDFAVSYMMKLIKEDLLLLDIKHDVFTSEKKLINDKSYNELKHYLTTNDLLYKGILEAPKGKKSQHYSTNKADELPCLIFKTSKFGDSADRVLEKADGSKTYFANDIMYHENKMQRGFYCMINLLGVDHKGYEKRLKAAVSALSNGAADLNILFTELVNLQINSKPVKMSKRSGYFLFLRDVLKEVPKDIFKIMMISRNNNSTLDFDLVKVVEKNEKNPVFYIQYAYVRINSVLNKAKDIFKDINMEELKDSNLLSSRLSLLQNLNELMLIKTIALYPKVLKTALKYNNVNLIFLLLMDISKAIHALWSAGKSDASLKFIIENNKELTFARLYLLLATKKVITALFNIVGIDKLELM